MDMSKLGRKGIILIIFILFLMQVSYATISVTPTTWVTNINPGQSLIKSFKFTNTGNSTSIINFNREGSNIDWISYTPSFLSIPASGSVNLTVILSVPSTSTNQVSISRINYNNGNSGSIDIIANVISSNQQGNTTTSCRLNPLITDYITRVQAGTNPFTRTFSVTVDNSCQGNVDIKLPITQGTTITSTGEKPISLVGSLSLGLKKPGDTASFDVEFNVAGLESGQYTPSILVIGKDLQGRNVETTIKFVITVTGGINPIPDITTLPIYTIPDSVTAGQSFEVIGQNVNLNLEPVILPNDVLVGESVSFSADGTWKWKGHTNGTLGKFTLSLVTLYKGNQMGRIITKEISVTGGGNLPSSDNLTLIFNPAIGTLVNGNTLAIQAKDSISGNLVTDAKFYINGVLNDGNVLTVTSGKLYQISAVHSNYNTRYFNFSLPKGAITINVAPSELFTGTQVILTTDPGNTTLYLDGAILQGTTFFASEGTHQIKAVKEGHLTTNRTVVVKTLLSLQKNIEECGLDSVPCKIKKNKGQTLELNRDTSWNLLYFKDAEDTPVIFQSGTNPQISFSPNQTGIYKLEAEGLTLGQYEVKGLFGKFDMPVWGWWVIGIAIVLIIIWIVRRGKSGESSEGSLVVQGN